MRKRCTIVKPGQPQIFLGIEHGFHPALGGHLAATVRVGLRSGYLPDPRAPVSWDVDT